MNVNSVYMYNVTNINFVFIHINYMPIFGNFYLPGIVQVACYCKFNNIWQYNALLGCTWTR